MSYTDFLSLKLFSSFNLLISSNLLFSMSQRINDVMKLCCELSANQQIQTTVKNSGKGAAAAGGLAFAGGVFGGPLGIAVGKWAFKKLTTAPPTYLVMKTCIVS